MAVKKGLKKGATFEDNGIKYVVKSVNKDGSYISVRADRMKNETNKEKEPEKEPGDEPVKTPEGDAK